MSNRFQENDKVTISSDYDGGRYQGQQGTITEVYPWPDGSTEVNQVKLADGSLWFSDDELSKKEK